ncbi:hypothetical protein M9458_053640, partial [Cirrhinus mrigala]
MSGRAFSDGASCQQKHLTPQEGAKKPSHMLVSHTRLLLELSTTGASLKHSSNLDLLQCSNPSNTLIGNVHRLPLLQTQVTYGGNQKYEERDPEKRLQSTPPQQRSELLES